MGIVNASGDSFSEARHSSADSALARGLAHLDCGADLLDIGGESTRPGAVEVSGDLEKMRVIPVVRNLKKVHPEVVLSIDTRHSVVARAALAAGAEIINDVSMLRHDPEIAALAAEGTTYVKNIHYVERGYERIIEKLNGLGAQIRRIEE